MEQELDALFDARKNELNGMFKKYQRRSAVFAIVSGALAIFFLLILKYM